MKTIKKYFASSALNKQIEEADQLFFSDTIKDELDSLRDLDGDKVTLYEVTFKPIKTGFVSTTTTITINKTKE